MFERTDNGGWLFQKHTAHGELVIISVAQTTVDPARGRWCARVSLSDDGDDTELLADTAVDAARLGVSELERRLGTATRRADVLWPHYNDDDWPLTMASADEIHAALAVSEAEAARRVSLSPSQLRRLRERGEGPPARWLSDRRIGYLVKDLEAWLESRPLAL